MNKKIPTSLPENATYGDAYGPLEYIETREEAKQYFEVLVDSILSHPNNKNMTRDEAEEITRSNIGYWSGYHDRKTAARILELFDATHPVFGKKHVDGTLKPEDAFKMGQELGAKNAKR